MESEMRIDKWLWAVRIFKSRSMASEACKLGKVKISDQEVKASREPKTGDTITIRMGILTKTVKLLAFPKSRVAAKLVTEYMQDLTPESEYLKQKMQQETKMMFGTSGAGRPTKKLRRDIDKHTEW